MLVQRFHIAVQLSGHGGELVKVDPALSESIGQGVANEAEDRASRSVAPTLP